MLPIIIKHIVLFFTFIGIHAIHAQPHAFTEEFARNPDIDYFRVEMRGDSVSFIVVNFKKDTLTPSEKIIRPEYYNFWFDGFLDRYLFGQKYRSAMTALSSKDVDSSRISNEPKKRQLLCAFIYPDSVVYQYRYSIDWLIHAAYREDGAFSRLGEELQHHAAAIAREKDSILIFQALIGLDANSDIEAMELIQGSGANYTDEIIDFFMSKKGAWGPFVKGGRPYCSLVDIGVRLSSDGKISASHSLSLRQPKIEVKGYPRMWGWYNSLKCYKSK